ncbi:MAG TPA: L-2-amino-thiazoline-4-carboxylic acid hydrolase [Dehalococcoidia bacterium]|nr:L-2-amino-thiazoline-4-carboxylic acid hydrolase [Dehalococcoidia bacterium]
MEKTELSPQERHYMANRLLNGLVIRLIKAMEERFGQEARGVANGVIYEMGQEVARQIRQTLGIWGGEPLDYARIHYYMDTNYWAITEKLIPKGPDEVLLRATACPAQGVFSAKDCAIYLPFVRGMMDTINPELQWVVGGKVLTKGDDCCEFTVTKGASSHAGHGLEGAPPH